MLIFREAITSDAPNIAQLHATSWKQHYRGAFSDVFLDTQASDDRFRVWSDRLNDAKSNQFVSVAEIDSSIVGFVCAYFQDDNRYGTLLDNLHVSRAMKGKGIGKQLMGLVAKEIQMGYPESGMYLWVLEQNSDAHKFYEAMGGQKIETVVGHDIGDRPVMKVRYYWPSVEKLLVRAKPKSFDQ